MAQIKYPTYAELGVTEPEEGIIQFEILPEHIKLLRNSIVCNTEMGAEINPVRPYGTRHIMVDIGKILGIEEPTSKIDQEQLLNVHNQMPLVHQIVLKTGKFKATTYRARKYSMDWKEYNPKLKRKKGDGQETLDSADAK